MCSSDLRGNGNASLSTDRRHAVEVVSHHRLFEQRHHPSESLHPPCKREAVLAFAQGVKRFGGSMVLLEQPVVRDDLDSMAAIRRETGIPVAADESVRSLGDAHEVVARGAADYINIKIMKTGVAEAIEIASFTKASGLKLMIGGMLETRIAMGCSFSLVLGLGGFDVLDLDTPLLLVNDPVTGGYRYEDSRLQPWAGPGLDMTAAPSPDVTTIE